MITRLGLPRRDPVTRDRYRAVARTAGIRRRSRLFWLDAVLVFALAITSLVAIPRVAGGVGSGVEQLVSSLQATIPLLQGRATIELPAGGAGGPVGAPIVEGVPQFTRDPQLRLSGRVPAFAVQPGRTLQISLNGVSLSTRPLEESGLFSAVLALKEGANAISVALLDRDVVATSSYTVTLDRTPPDLVLATPEANGVVDAQNVVVRGLTEAQATVTVNDRNVVPSPEGGFTDTFTATPGRFEITVVSRDRAGNETTKRVSVVARETTQITPTLTVALDRSSVRPGQQVVAAVLLRDVTGPRVGVQVTLSVGVVLIGSAVTDASGTARIGFAAPTTEGEIGVVVLGGGTSGRATLTVAR